MRIPANLAIILMLPTLAVQFCGAASPRSPHGTRADLIVVEKAKRLMTAYAKGKPIRSYRVALGASPIGPKEREGDKRTPEGAYTIDGRMKNSQYHRSLHISYPSPSDIARAKAGGFNPGGAVMIHGLKNGQGWVGSLHTSMDWTHGCIAVTDPEIEELWRIVPDGTPIHIKP
ncbi:L,D-transpeptidase family protein [Holophaga foetida]|uniref:L,D-transpeptidase family protein n=1 Tax=Holophaga foetida TaxID=35839 RepID=UPI00024749AC|nr:L,D-transpeptidase family protein [Holophaga foetida]